MSLRERFSEEMKLAMRARATARLSTIRLILAALKERDIANRTETNRDVANDSEILALLGKMVKQREESALAYEGGGRPELAQAERDEISVIREFMPRPLSEEQTVAAIGKAIAETGASSLKDMGKVMALLKERFAGQMDFARAGAEVRKALDAQKQGIA